MLGKCKYIMIYVQNIDAALDFYEITLNCQIEWQYSRYVGLSNGIILHDLPHLQNKPIPFFEVENVKQFVEEAQSRGVKINKEPFVVPIGFSSCFEDSNKNIIYVIDKVNDNN